MSDDVVHNQALANNLTYIPHLANELVHKIVSMIHSTDSYHCLLLILKVSRHSPWAVSARENFYASVQLRVRDRYCLASMVRSVASNGDGWQYVRSMCLYQELPHYESPRNDGMRAARQDAMTSLATEMRTIVNACPKLRSLVVRLTAENNDDLSAPCPLLPDRRFASLTHLQIRSQNAFEESYKFLRSHAAQLTQVTIEDTFMPNTNRLHRPDFTFPLMTILKGTPGVIVLLPSAPSLTTLIVYEFQFRPLYRHDPSLGWFLHTFCIVSPHTLTRLQLDLHGDSKDIPLDLLQDIVCACPSLRRLAMRTAKHPSFPAINAWTLPDAAHASHMCRVLGGLPHLEMLGYHYNHHQNGLWGPPTTVNMLAEREWIKEIAKTCPSLHVVTFGCDLQRRCARRNRMDCEVWRKWGDEVTHTRWDWSYDGQLFRVLEAEMMRR